MKQIEEMREILKDPAGYCQGLKAADGRKIVGTLCSYAPEEIIVAAGAHPLRLFGSGEKIQFAEAHLQTYCCSLVRGALEDALAGRLAFLDGVVFPHTCDSIQRLSDLWRLNVPGAFHLDVVLPVKLDSSGSQRYFIDVLNRSRKELGEKLGMTITDEALGAAIGLYNRIRAGLTRIDTLRAENPEILSGGEYYTLVRAAMVMDQTRLAVLLAEIVAELEAMGPGAASPGPAKKRIFLTGGICNHPDIYTIVEEAGGVVIGDDLCTGSRSFGGQIDAAAEPIAVIAERYRERIVCPAKHNGLTSRADHLVRRVGEKRADGVIFFLLKFCDPHAFDLPYLKEALTEAKIPSLLLEVEDRLPADGQLRTRLEAFIEML